MSRRTASRRLSVKAPPRPPRTIAPLGPRTLGEPADETTFDLLGGRFRVATAEVLQHDPFARLEEVEGQAEASSKNPLSVHTWSLPRLGGGSAEPRAGLGTLLSMRTLRLALCQMNATVGDLDGNVRGILEGVERAREAEADVVAFPELAITGYPPEDLLLKPSFLRATRQALDKIAAEVRGICAVVGFAHMETDLHNAAAVCADREVKDVYRKQYLPTYGVFDEDRYFRAGHEAPVFVIGGTKVGISICEDIWYPSGPAEWQSWAGAEVLVNVNASPFTAGKAEARRRMLATRASDYVTALAYVNLVGGQDELVFDGGSVAFDADGNLLASASQFSEALLVVDVDVDAVAKERLHDPRMRKISGPPSGVHTPEILVSGEQSPRRERIEPRIADRLAPGEELYGALCLGLRDYVDKNGFAEVIVGLSGGVDSSLTATIAADALGPERVLGVVMSSRYSSKHSREDAFALAENLGIRTFDLSIETAHEAMEGALEPYLEEEPGRDVAEQNVQARIRGVYLMALSNARPASLVLATGNKSELATGYATLYGDMAGGFAPLKDVPKTLVYRLAVRRNRAGEAIPDRVLSKPPSAELRADQFDEETLPAYDVLDPILELYVENDRSPEEIAEMGFDRETVRRVIAMVDRAEYKRRQAAPGVKVSARAFGRDRRLPITNRFLDE